MRLALAKTSHRSPSQGIGPALLAATVSSSAGRLRLFFSATVQSPGSKAMSTPVASSLSNSA